MSDLKRYIANRQRRVADFARGYDRGYAEFKVGVLIRQAGAATRLI